MGCSRHSAIAAAVLVSAIGAPLALADGLPVDGVDASLAGVGSLDGSDRFVTISAPTGTTVARIAQRGGQVEATRFLNGSFTIPAVAYDGSASGLSADGTRVVLIVPRPSFPRATTTFAVLDAKRLRAPKIERLRGDFSFDAISPDGRWIYLIEYTAATDPTLYQVRAYDLRTHRLAPGAIVDPREPDEKMQGIPVTRATSPDGRWAYTLYEKQGGQTPFVHALDTARREARCIDLDLMGSGPVQGMRMDVSADGGTVTVRSETTPRAVIDARTFAVSAPITAAATPTDTGRNAWPLLAGGVLATVLAGLGVRHMRRRGPHPTA